MPTALLGQYDVSDANRSHLQRWTPGELELGVAFRTARMVAEIPLAVLSTAAGC